MAVKIVTDSTADLPSDLAQALGITVVPLSINFSVRRASCPSISETWAGPNICRAGRPTYAGIAETGNH